MKIAARMGIVCDWERIRLRPAMRVGIVPVHCRFKKMAGTLQRSSSA